MIRSLESDVKLAEGGILCYDKAMADHRKIVGRTLIIILFFLLYTAIILIAAGPRMKRAFEESGVLAAIQGPKPSQSVAAPTRAVRVAFAKLGKEFAPYLVEQKRLGSTAAHDTYEALVGGPSLAALQDGAITFIDSRTRLLGLTTSANIIYLNFSKEFLASANVKMAYQQVKETARYLGAKDIVILIEGEEVPHELFE